MVQPACIEAAIERIDGERAAARAARGMGPEWFVRSTPIRLLLAQGPQSDVALDRRFGTDRARDRLGTYIDSMLRALVGAGLVATERHLSGYRYSLTAEGVASLKWAGPPLVGDACAYGGELARALAATASIPVHEVYRGASTTALFTRARLCAAMRDACDWSAATIARHFAMNLGAVLDALEVWNAHDDEVTDAEE